ncbi:hypothetical protein SAMN05720468_101112 [Fibrobacter sp. UWEL]|nr:hypothetical protein SAMN05720468_101112 [Fibrobacter sp. UWEL]
MKSVFYIIVLLLLSSCATIMNGGEKQLHFHSDEPRTKISVSAQHAFPVTGKDDVAIKVKKGDVMVLAEKTGCEPRSITVQSSFSGGWYILGNLFSFVYFGWIFDPILGGSWYYDQKSFDVTPDCGGHSYSESDDAWNQSLIEDDEVAPPVNKKKLKKNKQPVTVPKEPAPVQVEYPTTYVAVLETVSGADLLDHNSKLFLTDVMRDAASRALPAKQGFVVMTRENINVMLPPGKSLEECEGSCLAETGRNIAADFVAQARIGKFANFLTITVELYETKSSKLISSITARASDEEQLLVEIENHAEELFGKVIENR